MDAQLLTKRCCIVGGGPAGMMLGFLLAKASVDTVVLEKWPDFFRDFRGDTIHPSTMEVLSQLGLLDEFLKLPHSESRQLTASIGTHTVTVADFSHLHVHCPFIAFIPQWDFLNFIAEQAKALPNFQLLMNTEATDLIEEKGRIVGVRATSNEGPLDIRAELVVGADGRHSTVRKKSGLTVDSLSAPMDVLWFRLSRKAGDPSQSLGRIDLGHIIIMIERTDYWQCGFLIRKGEFEQVKQAGLAAFQQSLVDAAPSMADRAQELTSWDDIKLLEVVVDRLPIWHRPGLLCIGDSAHAMSPIGGVGINLAIQDAVASANVLAAAFLQGPITETTLAAVQKRRQLPTRIIQRVQVFLQNHVIAKILGHRVHPNLPWPLKLLQHFPLLRRLPAYFIGMGIRPEHLNLPPEKNG